MDEEIASIRIVPEAFEKNKEIEALSIFEVVCKVNAMIVKQLNLSMKDLFLGRLDG